MPEFNCQSCGKLLKTPDGSEGKQGRCPHCGQVMSIPGGRPGAATPSAPQLGLPPARPPQPGQPTNPGQPSSHPIKPGAMPAGFPQVGPAGQVPGPASANPFSNAPQPGYPGFGGPMGMGPAMGMYRGQPHRGGSVLGFGIVALIGGIGSLMTCVPCLGCFMLPMPLLAIGFGIPAWIMGQRDLKLIQSGQMDPSGEGQTKTGFIMGIIGVCLGALGILIFAGVIILQVVMNAGAF